MRRKSMLSTAVILYIVAVGFFALFFIESTRPISDTPMYPRTPDTEAPFVYFVPNEPVIRVAPGHLVTINILIVDWQNEIEHVVVYRNATLLEENIDYVLSRPGTSTYERKVFQGCRDELIITWRTSGFGTVDYELTIKAFDSIDNERSIIYNFRVEAVQNTPEYYLSQPTRDILLDLPVIPIEVIVTSNATLISSGYLVIDGLNQGTLTWTGSGFVGEVASFNIPTGVHDLEVQIELRSGLLLTTHFLYVVHNPSMVPSVAPAVGAFCILFGTLVLLIRREKKPEDEKYLVGIRGKLFVEEREKKKKKK